MQAGNEDFENNLGRGESEMRNPNGRMTKLVEISNAVTPCLVIRQFRISLISDLPLRHFHPLHLVRKILRHDHPRRLVDEGQVLRQFGHGENIADADLVLGPQGGFHRVGLDRLAVGVFQVGLVLQDPIAVRFQGVAGIVEAEPDEDLPGVAVLADFIERDRGRGDPLFLLAFEQIGEAEGLRPCPAASPARNLSARQFLSAAAAGMARATSISTAELPSRGNASFSAWGSSAAMLPPLESRTLRSAIRCLMAIGCSRGSQATSSETCKAGGDELRNSRLASTDTGSIRIGPWIAARPVRGRSFGPRGTICNARGWP